MKGVVRKQGVLLLSFTLWLSLILVACSDPTVTSKPAPPVIAPTITIQPTTPSAVPVQPSPTSNTITTVAPKTATASAVTTSSTNPATITVIPPPVAPTAEADSIPTTVASLPVPKLDVSTEGVILYEYNCDIWVLTLPEGVRSQLTKDGADNCKDRQFFNRFPVWSPDSLQIAYASVRDVLQDPDHTLGYEVYTMRPDGSNLKRVTQTHGSLARAASPMRWLPTGDILVENNDKPLLDPATGQLKALPANYKVGSFAISPDKAYITYAAGKQGSNSTATTNPQKNDYEYSLYIAPLNGGTPKLLTSTTNNNPVSTFAWSPDAKTIAYIQHLDQKECGSYRFYTISKDGGTPKKLFEMGEQKYYAPQILSYAPNGKWLTYGLSQCGGGDTKIFLLDTEKGDPPIELTKGFNPSYGRKIGG